MKKIAYVLASSVSALAALLSSATGGRAANSQFQPEQNTGVANTPNTIKVSQAAKLQIAQAVELKRPGLQNMAPGGVVKPVKPAQGGWIDTFKDKGKGFYETKFIDTNPKTQVTTKPPAGNAQKQFQGNQPGKPQGQ